MSRWPNDDRLHRQLPRRPRAAQHMATMLAGQLGVPIERITVRPNNDEIRRMNSGYASRHMHAGGCQRDDGYEEKADADADQ